MIYAQGTISIVSGSAIVRGTGTQFKDNLNGIAPGQVIIIQSGNSNLLHMIQAVNSDTELVLADKATVTLDNTTYQIQTTVPDSISDGVRHMVAINSNIINFLQNMDKWSSENGVVDITLPNGRIVSLQSIQAMSEKIDQLGREVSNQATPKAVKAAYDLANTANQNANRRLDKAQNGADIPDKKAFVSNLGLEKTVELAANALDKRTGGTVSGAVTVGQLMTPALTIGSGGVYDGNRDAASFEGNNIEIRSWHGVGFKSTHNSPNDVTSIYFNTRNGDIAAQGSISSQGDIASQGNLSILKNASVKGKISADEGLIAGTASQNAILTPWGDLHGNTWGGWLSHWLNATFARKNSGVVSGKGWFKDESTGLIIQWGSESESNRNFSFPHMFSEACFVVLVTNSTSQGARIDNAFGYPVNNSEFYAATKREDGIVNGFPVAWLAIGR